MLDVRTVGSPIGDTRSSGLATLTGTIPNRSMVNPRVALWLAAASTLAALLALLVIAIRSDPSPVQDRAVLAWVAGWDVPGLAAFFGAVSFLTDNWPALGLGIAGVAFLWLLGFNREAFAFAIVGGIVGLAAVGSDYTLGQIVDRARPLLSSGTSFPSGHVFGSTVFFGFWAFMAIHYKPNKKLMVPAVGLPLVIILSVGPARIYEQAHWPSDVAAGYLLGVLGLLALIPLFLYLRRATWFASKQDQAIAALTSENTRLDGSIASVVVLDPQRGTATKIYTPPPLVRLLYWLAFQARFPYESNLLALQAGTYRRKIASLLTIHRFGKDLVAPVTALHPMNGRYSFVTEFVPGEKVENDEAAKSFLAQVTATFTEAGLPVWQVNPSNPHAHTNVIRTPEGDLKIIDLESALFSLPARGQWRSALKSGTIPVFDDIDFPRLKRYVAANEAALEASLGPDGLAELKDAVEQGEQTIRSWKDAEPRIWGRLARLTYRLLDWKALLQRLKQALTGADRAGEAFLSGGIDRWEKEGRLEPLEAARLQAYLSTGEVRDALHHLGAHLVLSAILRFPIGSIVRFGWTVAFWGMAQSRRFRHRTAAPERKVSNIHNPLVMALALVPGFGAIAYLAARPLRQRLLVRLMLDQIAWKLPFRLYARLRLGRWLAPAVKKAECQEPAEVRDCLPLAAD